jgi:predicted nucleotidyltransferase
MTSAVADKQHIFTLIEKNQRAVSSLGVARLGLFGSFVRHEQDADSDIDVLVEFTAGRKSFDNFMALQFLLEDLFNRPVELVTPESLSPTMKASIIDEAEYVTLS